MNETHAARNVSRPNSTSNSVIIMASTDPVSVMAATCICVLVVCTLAANMCVCYAIARYRSVRRLQYVTGCFVMNLCVADILVALISMPVWAMFQLYGIHIGLVVGKTFLTLWGCVDILCGTAIILSLCAISIDRYLAITRPLVYQEYCTSRRVVGVIGLIWFYSTAIAGLRQLPWPTRSGYAWLVLAASLVIPFGIILVAYGKIFQVASRHARELRRLPNLSYSEHHKRTSHDLKAARTIAVVIGTFVCCWIPFCVLSVLYGYNLPIDITIGNATKWLAYLNALLNPVVYSCLDKQLRNIVLKRVICWKRYHNTTQSQLSSVCTMQLRENSTKLPDNLRVTLSAEKSRPS